MAIAWGLMCRGLRFDSLPGWPCDNYTCPWLFCVCYTLIIIAVDHVIHKSGITLSPVFNVVLLYHIFPWLCSKCYITDDFIILGKHVGYKHLDYKPQMCSAVTSIGNSHVMAAQEHPPALHIHQLPSGETVRSISHEELGLRGDDYLHGITFTGLLLHLAIGEYRATKSLHA